MIFKTHDYGLFEAILSHTATEAKQLKMWIEYNNMKFSKVRQSNATTGALKYNLQYKVSLVTLVRKFLTIIPNFDAE